MKKIVSIILVLTMAFSVFPAFSAASAEKLIEKAPSKSLASGVKYGDITYSIEDNWSITITSCDPSATGDITIPASINDPWTGAIPCPVTKIGNEAFRMCMDLTSITLPETITSIGENAFFGCTSLTSINLPTGLSELGAHAFRLCKGLTELNIPGALSSISDYAFKGCSGLKTLAVPSTVSSIGIEAFSDCSSLKEVTFEGKVNSIADSAFKNCGFLSAAYFETLPPASFGKGVFEGASSLFTIYYFEENASAWAPNGEKTYSPNAYPLAAYDNKMSDTYDGLNYIVTDENTVTIVSVDDSKLTNTVIIPEKIGGRYVTAIDRFAFSGAMSLYFVVIPESITSIGDYAFYGCSSLHNAYFRGPTPTSFGSGVFDDTASDFRIYYRSENKSSWAPNDETTRYGYPIIVYSNIGSGTYGIFTYSVSDTGTITITGCEEAPTGAIEIPSMIGGFPVTEIAANAFFGMSEITSVTIPSSLTTIGMMAFSKCEKITAITIPDSVISLGASVFAGCYALETVTIGSGLESFGNFWAFNCYALKKINISEANPNYASIDGVVYNKNITKLVTYPTAKTGDFVFPATVAEMESSAMAGAPITSVTLPAAMTVIPSSAFSSCTSLTKITFPSTVTEIGSNAFDGCSALETVMFPESLTTLGFGAFRGCKKLKSAYFLGDKPTSNGYYIFNSVAEGFTIYYPSDRKSSWSPAGEDNWYGYPIAEFGASDVSSLTPTFGSPYTVDGDVLKGIATDTAVSDVISYFEDSANVRMVNASGSVLVSTDTVGTGCKVQLVKDAVVVDELTVLIVGDMTGDGKVNSRDIATLQKHIIGTSVLEGVFFTAANVNDDVDNDGNAKVNSRDIAELQKIISA